MIKGFVKKIEKILKKLLTKETKSVNINITARAVHTIENESTKKLKKLEKSC